MTPDKFFYLSGGGVIRSLKELVDALKDMDDSVFRFHVNDSKNDFAEWVKHAVDRPEIAEKIRRLSKDEASDVLREYVYKTEDSEFSVKSKTSSDESGDNIQETLTTTKNTVKNKGGKDHGSEHVKKHVSKRSVPQKNKKETLAKHDKKSVHKKNTGSAKKVGYSDDFDLDEMMSEIDLGKQKSMLSKINERIEKMNKEIDHLTSNKGHKLDIDSLDKEFSERSRKKKSSVKKTSSKGSSKKSAGKRTKASGDNTKHGSQKSSSAGSRSGSKKNHTTGDAKKNSHKKVSSSRVSSRSKTDKLMNKYKGIMTHAVKKTLDTYKVDEDSAKSHRAGHPTGHAGKEDYGFEIVDKSDTLKGIDDEYYSEASYPDSSGTTLKHSPNKKTSGGLKGFFRSMSHSFLPDVKNMEKEKKAHESYTVDLDPSIHALGVLDFVKGLLVGMIIGMVFLLVF